MQKEIVYFLASKNAIPQMHLLIGVISKMPDVMEKFYLVPVTQQHVSAFSEKYDVNKLEAKDVGDIMAQLVTLPRECGVMLTTCGNGALNRAYEYPLTARPVMLTTPDQAVWSRIKFGGNMVAWDAGFSYTTAGLRAFAESLRAFLLATPKPKDGQTIEQALEEFDRDVTEKNKRRVKRIKDNLQHC